MTTLSAKQIYGYARGAGFSPASAVVATAVALAESGGRTEAHNTVPPDDSYGLWQVNMLGALGPARRAQFGLSNDAQLYDPATNARAAYAISSGGKNFGAWSTYTDGAYKSELGRASAVNGAPPLTGSLAGAATSDTAGSSSSGGGVFSSLTGALSGDFARVAVTGILVAGGAALVVVGLLRSVQPAVQKVASVAGTAAKVAAA